MLRDDMTPMSYRIRFLDNDVERTHYSDDRRHFEQLIAQHGHLSDLQIEPLTLTPEQQQRLDAIKDAGLSTHDAAVYVQHGTTESGPLRLLASPSTAYITTAARTIGKQFKKRSPPPLTQA